MNIPGLVDIKRSTKTRYRVLLFTEHTNPISKSSFKCNTKPYFHKTLTNQSYNCSSDMVSCSSLTARALLLVFVLFTTSDAARIGPPPAILQAPMHPSEPALSSHSDVKTIKSFRFKGLAFGFLPKGPKVAPSGPSKRHNDAVASTPKH